MTAKHSTTPIDAPAATHIRYFVVDAFTNRPFTGNPAAVVPLDHENALMKS